MTAALILAAGNIADGAIYSPIEEFGGTSPIRRLISVFHQAGVERVVIITGYNADRLERHCSGADAIFLRNADYETSDMLASAKIGLEYLKDKCERAFITPADVPFFSLETLKAMMAPDADQAEVSVPIVGVVAGHPLLVYKSAFAEILEYDGPNGLRGVLTSKTMTRRFVDVSDNGVLYNFNDDSGLDELLGSFPPTKIGAGLKVWLTADNGFLGPGTLRLLKRTIETKSLSLAARQLGVSYSKAQKLIANIETRLGCKVLNRVPGGKNGGSSEVTPQGLELIRRYELFMNLSTEAVNELFTQVFSDAEGLW